MPRPPRRSEPATPPPNSVIASAANMTGKASRIPRARGARPWQEEAWYFYDAVGELRFSVNYIANSLSRVSLFVVDEDDRKVETGQPAEALEAMTKGDPGQLMSLLGSNLTTAGEGYLIGEDDPDEGDTWNVFSTQEVKPPATKKGMWEVDRGEIGGKRKLNPEDVWIIRIWRRHPRLWAEADSPVRAVLPNLREIESLSKHIGAGIDSRLAGAGILLLPSEMSFGTPGSDPNATPAVDPKADPFMAALTEAMTTAIGDRDSASAVVPIVVKAPGDSLAHVQHVTFSSPLDESALSLREEAIRRFALGIDLPPEVVLGQAASNHWTAWAIDEASIKVHIEPICELICDAVTREYLWAALGDTDEAHRYRVAYDTSELRVRQDNSQSAIALYDRLELTGDALRRETGFGEEDKPEDSEVADILLRKAAVQSSLSPETVLEAFAQLGVDLTPEPTSEQRRNTAVQQQIGARERPVAPLPLPPRQPVNPVAEQRPVPTQEAASAMLAACEVTALRGIEKARARLNRKRHGIDAAAVTTALAGVWDGVPRVAELCGVDPAWLTARLDRYARAVITEGVEHKPEVLTRLLSDA